MMMRRSLLRIDDSKSGRRRVASATTHIDLDPRRQSLHWFDRYHNEANPIVDIMQLAGNDDATRLLEGLL